MASTDQMVQAPAPALGKPSMPAPTQTPAMMHAPPTNDGFCPIYFSKDDCGSDRDRGPLHVLRRLSW
ncbi:hypothetical protein NUITMVA1_44850 [Aeromonas hydrophila]|nr:hypothetical protein NUITMVA1_44850 [Aeromonas hydrophila]